MTGVMSSDTRSNDKPGVFVIEDLGKICSKVAEDLLPLGLPFGVRLLRAVSRNFSRRLVALAARGQKDDRRQQVKAAKGRYELRRGDVVCARVHF